MSILFALGFLVVGFGVYQGIEYMRAPKAEAEAPSAALEQPGAKRGQAAAHPLQKHLEATGVRLTQNAKKGTDARFVLVNHSAAEMAGLAGTVTLWGRTRNSDEEAVGTVKFELPSLGPYESKEVTAPLDTKLRVYELPDWQNLVTEIQITAP